VKFVGLDGMDDAEIESELKRGGKFVIYQYCVSVILMTFKRPSDIYFIRADESRVSKGLSFSAISLLFGWWGIPWGPIYTISSLFTNFCGGRDVTPEILRSLASTEREADAKSEAKEFLRSLEDSSS
jgi:hypothetical protein